MELMFELQDGKRIPLASGMPAAELLRVIGGAGIAVRIGPDLLDPSMPLTAGGKVAVVLPGSDAALPMLRDTTAHVLAHAVVRRFGRDAVTCAVGRLTDDGFYYDFDVATPFTPEDLEAIEAEMLRIVDEDLRVTRRVVRDRAAARSILEAAGCGRFQRETIDELPADATIGFVTQGEFTDLCGGAQLASTGQVGAHFKLLSTAAAYWRGDARRETLQRIWGTAFFSADGMTQHLARIEEARRRDHRLLGRELELFHFASDAPGHPIWLPRGMVCYRAMETMIREKIAARGYVETRTPVLIDTSVWQTTGHMDHYRDAMFFVEAKDDNRQYGLKPMNCPGSAMVFRSDLRSYRELPLRLAEFGMVHRHERSGVLSGLTRVRSFTQDDAHIYCTPDQLEDELKSLFGLVREVYELFGFDDLRVHFSTRPSDSTGSDEMWQRAEGSIRSVLGQLGGNYVVAPGEGAFYGPKIDFLVLDSLKREWQLATIQVDFALPENFDLHFVDQGGQKKRPVLIHRAILGSFERMLAILIEHYGGAFPLWLAPEQVRLVPVAEAHKAACGAALQRLLAAGLRATADLRNQSMNAKVRDATLAKVNYVLVIGDREVESGKVTVRRRDGEQVGTMSVASVIAALQREAASRSLHPGLAPPLDVRSGDASAAPATRRSTGGTMRAVRLRGVGEAVLLRDVPVPEPGPREVRIKVLAAGICGTDKHLCAGDATVVEKAKPPRTLGHEFCGEIDEVGSDARDLWRPGEYVTAEMHVVCGTCPQCRTGNGHVCENTVICGLHADGSFADYVVVPASNVIRLDRNAVPLKVGAFLDALGNAVHCAQATSVSGRNIAVLGYGPIGAMAASVVEFMGAAQVFVTEVHPYNLAHARDWARSVNERHPRGLERVVILDTSSKERRVAAGKEVRDRTNGAGVDAALEISGHPDAINDGLAMIRWGGELIELGIGKENAVTLHNWNGDVVFKGRTVKGIIGRRMYDTWNQMLGLLQAGLDVGHIVTMEASLDDFPEAMAKFRRNEAMKVVLYPTDER